MGAISFNILHSTSIAKKYQEPIIWQRLMSSAMPFLGWFNKKRNKSIPFFICNGIIPTLELNFSYESNIWSDSFFSGSVAQPICRFQQSNQNPKLEVLHMELKLQQWEKCTSWVMLSNSLTASVNFATSSSSTAAAKSCHSKHKLPCYHKVHYLY